MNNKPVAWMSIQEGIFSPSFKYLFSETEKEGFIPLYTHPADLTDEEIIKLFENDELWARSSIVYQDDAINFARAIMKKCGIINGTDK